MCDEQAFIRDFQQPVTRLTRRLANHFNVSFFNVAFNVAGELPLTIKSEIGKRLLAPFSAGQSATTV